MCRWVAYRGAPRFLEDLILAPDHSLIEQSHCASEAKTATNGDGFGFAWYGEREEPGHYRDILPAWSDENLQSLSRQIRSRLFLAHVRASTAGRTARDNCHPFVLGNWSFMHNGQIKPFDPLERRMEMRLSDRLYHARAGSTDAELLFLLAHAFGLDSDPKAAMERTIGFVKAQAREVGIDPQIRFTAAFSDGHTLYAVRYATDRYAPTLYSGPLSQACPDGSQCLVSEPFEDSLWAFTEIPAGSFVTVSDRGLDVSPFVPSQTDTTDGLRAVAV